MTKTEKKVKRKDVAPLVLFQSVSAIDGYQFQMLHSLCQRVTLVTRSAYCFRAGR